MKVNVEKLRLIADLVHPVKTRVFLTTSNWARIAAEINLVYKDSLVMPSGKPTPKNFREMVIRSTTFINSGTDDQDVCNLLNAPEEARTPFRFREANFAVRRA
jgi:hypothetical protein